MKKEFIGLSVLCFFLTPPVYSQESGKFGVGVENHYYDWESRSGLKGSQYVMPVNVYYQHNNGFNMGLRSAYIHSENKSPNRSGTAKHWSDASLSASYTAFQESDFPVRFNLSTNLPTGKATLSGDEKNAIMDGHLVWQTRLGEGLNITPGVNVAHSFTDNDTVGFGVSHVFRGSFDPTGDIENDKINPGDDTIVALSYAHQNNRAHIETGLNYQHSGTTKRNNQPYYQKGDLWSANIDAQFAVASNQTIYGGYGYSYRQKDKYINHKTGNLEAEQFNSNGSSHNFHIGYSYRLKENQSLGIALDYLKINSNKYDAINDLYVPARYKVGVGINYQYQITPQAQLSLSAKRFRMKDRATPTLAEQDYRGWNVFGSINYQF